MAENVETDRDKPAEDSLGALWDASIASGPAPSGTTMAEIKAEARRRRDQAAGAAPGLR